MIQDYKFLCLESRWTYMDVRGGVATHECAPMVYVNGAIVVLLAVVSTPFLPNF